MQGLAGTMRAAGQGSKSGDTAIRRRLGSGAGGQQSQEMATCSSGCSATAPARTCRAGAQPGLGGAKVRVQLAVAALRRLRLKLLACARPRGLRAEQRGTAWHSVAQRGTAWHSTLGRSSSGRSLGSYPPPVSPGPRRLPRPLRPCLHRTPRPSRVKGAHPPAPPHPPPQALTPLRPTSCSAFCRSVISSELVLQVPPSSASSSSPSSGSSLASAPDSREARKASSRSKPEGRAGWGRRRQILSHAPTQPCRKYQGSPSCNCRMAGPGQPSCLASSAARLA